MINDDWAFLLLSDVGGVSPNGARILKAGLVITLREFDTIFDRKDRYELSFHNAPGKGSGTWAICLEEKSLWRASAEDGIVPLRSYVASDQLIWNLMKVALHIPLDEMVKFAGDKTSCKELDTIAKARLKGIL